MRKPTRWVGYSGCCTGIRGDVDYDSKGPNIADLTYFVEYMFFGSPAPPCREESDANGSGAINVADMTYLVEFLFFDGPAPPPCP